MGSILRITPYMIQCLLTLFPMTSTGKDAKISINSDLSHLSSSLNIIVILYIFKKKIITNIRRGKF